ncbi:MAG: hypothetical protein N2109_07685 [Fimbriimonadales bacterium]|nr:hypothetical protein [Fimbriimonadales bacterium]
MPFSMSIPNIAAKAIHIGLERNSEPFSSESATGSWISGKASRSVSHHALRIRLLMHSMASSVATIRPPQAT